MEVYEKYLKEGIDIIAVSLSSGVSGTHQTCQVVAEELLKKYPERRIVCIDSLRYSTALSLLCILAAEK